MDSPTLDSTKIFGFAPDSIGLRHRAWWIVTIPDEDDVEVGAQPGWLCVRARDGASNPMDLNALRMPNCVDTREDAFDRTYRYYWFKPL